MKNNKEMGWYRAINTKIEASGFDWVIHISVGAVVAYLVMVWAENLALRLRVILAILTALMVGVFIELFDLHFDMQDVSEYMAGAVVGSIIWLLLRSHNDK